MNQFDKSLVTKLLKYDLEFVANKLQFINNRKITLEDEELPEIIGLIDELSMNSDELSQKIVTLLCTLLFKYKHKNWSGLNEFLVIALSRIGLSPTAIMVDEDYDAINGKHLRFSSFISELSVSINRKNFEVEIRENKFTLTKFQKEVWDKIDKYKITGISAPTSAGKSFVILLKVIEKLLFKKGTVVYIVPNLSLVSQVSSDFRKILNKFGIKDYKIYNSFDENERLENRIYVLTQERAIGAFAYMENPFPNLRFLIVDEIQNIERVSSEDDDRSKTLFDTLIEFRNNSLPDKILISGPRIKKIEELAKDIFGEDAIEQETKQSPVVNLTYSVNKKGNKYYLKQYSDVIDKPNVLLINNTQFINGIGKKRYTENFHRYLRSIIKGLGEESINIIFSPNAVQARKTARAIKEEYINTTSCDKVADLIDYVKRTVHPKYDLVETLKYEVAYHHGRLPHHIRKVLESAITNKLIKNVVCTTTLMQGVNLPAQNVVIRNPNLFVDQRGDNPPKLSNYEFANLRGRAGRLMKDLIGRTFVLDENSFEIETNKQESLFDSIDKELRAGYEEKFNINKDILIDCLVNNTPSNDDIDSSYLLPYVRYNLLKYGLNAKNKLEEVGINIPENQLVKIKEAVESLSVPKEICIHNRYWDPIELDKLYNDKNKPYLPISPIERNITNNLYYLILYMKDKVPFYYKKHLGIQNEGLILSLCINAEKWIKETPLSKILDTDYHDSSSKIEKTISLLQNTITYKLPALLKPLYNILLPESSFLSYLEMGAYRVITRKLIEMGVPRETALSLSNNYLDDINAEEIHLDEILYSRLRSIDNQINYWEKVQLESIL
ncbi:DEAD/DEAH box helicase [Bacillus subtilis]|uniref:DEAD/DEAH box helicase n=1 Tax=Bacillus subtilis TaxID=1423 RepID=UPI002675B520|nr:DEAD/DEAH box helicase [Bacillus subtilis]MDO3654788.1 DEAD/DEAH box helicase [Bacillus subtilis]